MTKNDKAATYLGWPDKYTCSGYLSNVSLLEGSSRGYSGPCFHPDHANGGKHVYSAPDMSLPENYMRALERFDEWHVDNVGGNEHWRVRRGLLEGEGDSAREALADYYDGEAELDDAEHEESKP